MTDEKTTSPETPSTENKPVNPMLEEVKAERLALDKVRAEAKAEADRLEQLRSDQLLSGTAGGHVHIPTAEELKQKRIQEEVDGIVKAFR